MTCLTCGQVAQGAERFCANCGADLTKLAMPASASPMTAAAPALAPEATPQLVVPAGKLRGVGGWLLLFCVWITVIDSLFALPLLDYLRHGALNWMLSLSLGLTAYGVFTGIQLWRGDRRALVFLRIYFVLVFVFALITFAAYFRVLYFYGTSFWVGTAWVRVVAFLAIWVTYFRVSKRVRDTYGRNL